MRDARPAAARRSLAFVALALALGAMAAVIEDPRPRVSGDIDVGALADAVVRELDHVDAKELADWLYDRRPGLRVIDLRSAAEFDRSHIPSAERMSLHELTRAAFDLDDTIVLYSGGGAHAAQAWVFLRARGYERVYFLRGGLLEWEHVVLGRPTGTSDDDEAPWRRGC